jgi:hypothetical protein
MLNGLSAVYRIRIRKFFGLPDPDPLVRKGTDPYPSVFCYFL